VTLAGRSWAARVGASLLAAVGQDALVTRSVAEYVDCVQALARDRGRLADLRAALQTRLSTASPFAPRRMAARLERAIDAMWARHLADLPPCDLELPD
jgi:predicted O-linked N-acetylglucosamine transferase (SPINDLY family)